MDYLVVAVAAMLAGVGTGLVGLSAATVMVPLLIVLCPVFGGEHGAFMATAIALASDVLGSAVTAYVYARHKRIDLKHGWLLLTCIVLMCTVGSVAAYFTHQSVLGSCSLFLCVAIGIRFLVKPDAKERPDRGGEVRLTAKEIAVSLFFGLTIGFGTGFFGSGGGMMMLIVFTAMLGYDRRTAVGTSTFIMTFTALIAVFWGGFGETCKYIPVAAIMAWGPGDGAAAICGKRFGRHKLQGRMIEGVKSVEGSVAMAVVSFCCTLPVLLTMLPLSTAACVLLALGIAPVAALTELYTKHGLDTITVPIVAALILGAATLM